MAAVSFAFLLLVIIRSQFRCLVLPQPVIMSTFSAAFDALYEHRHLLTTEDFELRKAELRAQWPLLGGSVAATRHQHRGLFGFCINTPPHPVKQEENDAAAEHQWGVWEPND